MNYQVISQIAQRLAQVSQLKWIDLDYGQLDTTGERPAVAFPACLIDLAYPVCDNVSQYQQVVTCNVQLRLAFSPINTPRLLSGAEANHVAITNGVTPIIEAVHEAMQGWETGSLSPLQRLTVTPEKRRDGIKVYRVIYQTTFMETADPLVVPDPEEPEQDPDPETIE